jgi:hypothetical protein
MKLGGVKVNLYTVYAALVGADGGILAFVQRFGDPHLSTTVGSILAGLGGLAVVAHTYLSDVTIELPAAAYGVILKVFGVVTGLLGAAGVITQLVNANAPTFSPIVTTIFLGASLAVSLAAGVFHLSAAKRLGSTLARR